MKIFDCIIFNGEVDLLRMRIQELQNYVHKVVVVESDTTFSGNKKAYTDLSDFDEKVLHLKVTDGIEDYKNKQYFTFFADEPMQREFFLRNQIIKGLQHASPDDIILLSDCDEIPKLYDVSPEYDLFLFHQDCLQLKYDLLNPGMTPFFGTVGVKFKHLGLPSELRIFHRPYVQIDAYDNLKTQTIHDGGWHFSFCMNAKKIIQKVSDYAHCERLWKHNDINERNLNFCIDNKKDIWGGKYNTVKDTKDLIDYPHDNLPNTVKNNIESYRHMLHS